MDEALNPLRVRCRPCFEREPGGDSSKPREMQNAAEPVAGRLAFVPNWQVKDCYEAYGAGKHVQKFLTSPETALSCEDPVISSRMEIQAGRAGRSRSAPA